jgi:hypothetical protein
MTPGFWEWERFGMQVVFLGLLVRLIRGVRALLGQARQDREARELAIEDLRRTADALALRTAEMTKARDDRNGERFDSLDRELGHNTEMTVKAAEASAEAAHVANDMNKKIEATNERLERVVKDQA